MKTDIIEIHPDFPELNHIHHCAKIIRQGGLVIFPTETVYGIAADFSNKKAIEKLRQVKQRSDNKPFSVLISQKGLISNYTSSRDPKIYKLIDAFWPGPLTVVVPAKEEGQTIGLRMPDNLIALRLTGESQCAVAAPSANIEGKEPPRTCQEALADLDGLVDIAIDGGQSRIGRGSTVVDMTTGDVKVLRESVVAEDQILNVTNKKTILFVCTGNSCRSVMAEYLLRHMLAGRADVNVISAGTGVFIQSSASAETVTCLYEEGVTSVDHLSQPVSSILLRQADLIFVMTRGHRQQVLERVPEVERRVYLLREFVNEPAGLQSNLDIPDPIGKSQEAYKECFEVIKSALVKIKELV